MINGKDVAKSKGTGVHSIKNMNALRKLEADIDAKITRTLQVITVDNLSDECHIEAFDNKMTVESVLLHMIEEELQHLGEVNCLFWQMGIEPPHLKEGIA